MEPLTQKQQPISTLDKPHIPPQPTTISPAWLPDFNQTRSLCRIIPSSCSITNHERISCSNSTVTIGVCVLEHTHRSGRSGTGCAPAVQSRPPPAGCWSLRQSTVERGEGLGLHSWWLRLHTHRWDFNMILSWGPFLKKEKRAKRAIISEQVVR